MVCKGFGRTDQRQSLELGRGFSGVNGANGDTKGILGRGKVKPERERRQSWGLSAGPENTCRGGRQIRQSQVTQAGDHCEHASGRWASHTWTVRLGAGGVHAQTDGRGRVEEEQLRMCCCLEDGQADT